MNDKFNYEYLNLFFDEEIRPIHVSNAIRSLIIERCSRLAKDMSVATVEEGEEWEMLNFFCDAITKLGE